MLSKLGIEVQYLIVTNGDAGGLCYEGNTFYNCSKPALAHLRQREQEIAAAYLGVKRVHFLDLEDGMVTSYPEQDIRESVTVVVRSYRPHIVITFFTQPAWNCPPMRAQCPQCWDDLGYHPDHQAVGKICLDTVIGFSASDRLMFQTLSQAGLHPWSVEQFYMFALTTSQTHFVDITGVPLQQKIAAFMKHKSQVHGEVEQVSEQMTWAAAQIGASSNCSYAENFQAFF